MSDERMAGEYGQAAKRAIEHALTSECNKDGERVSSECSEHKMYDRCRECGWGYCDFCGHDLHDGEFCDNCPTNTVCGPPEQGR